jgi:flagellar L-ring protein precursor FlgH
MRSLAIAATGAFLAGCASSLTEIGVAPAMSPVGSGYAADMSAQHYPEAPATPVKRFSLWDDRHSRFFVGARALAVGDILTVLISINDKARFKNESDRKRIASRGLGVSGGYEWNGVGSGGSADIDIGSDTISAGAGKTERSEDIKLSVAAVVTGVMANGNLIISGSQEVRVNAELRVLTIGGIVRPSDIGPNNTIFYDRIAEARISYGGRGRLSEVQQPPWGQQIIDIVSPF